MSVPSDRFSTGNSAQNSGLSAQKKLLGRPFPKGKSGNPGGRPKKLEITRIFEKMLAKPDKRKELQKIVEDILAKRGMAAVLLLREIIERTEGKVSQEVDLSGSISMLSDADLAAKIAKMIEK